jgi:hypothetical protein
MQAWLGWLPFNTGYQESQEGACNRVCLVITQRGPKRRFCGAWAPIR